jgi:hypothetical protein
MQRLKRLMLQVQALELDGQGQKLTPEKLATLEKQIGDEICEENFWAQKERIEMGLELVYGDGY